MMRYTGTCLSSTITKIGADAIRTLRISFRPILGCQAAGGEGNRLISLSRQWLFDQVNCRYACCTSKIYGQTYPAPLRFAPARVLPQPLANIRPLADDRGPTFCPTRFNGSAIQCPAAAEGRASRGPADARTRQSSRVTRTGHYATDRSPGAA